MLLHSFNYFSLSSPLAITVSGAQQRRQVRRGNCGEFREY